MCDRLEPCGLFGGRHIADLLRQPGEAGEIGEGDSRQARLVTGFQSVLAQSVLQPSDNIVENRFFQHPSLQQEEYPETDPLQRQPLGGRDLQKLVVAQAGIQHGLLDLAAEQVAHRVDAAANRMTEDAQHPFHPGGRSAELRALRHKLDELHVVFAKQLLRLQKRQAGIRPQSVQHVEVELSHRHLDRDRRLAHRHRLEYQLAGKLERK
ncbi:hypothetical protein K9B32_25995 [Rhizobium sp. 3T7]|uniref:hypothetical protein n=1 Tax=Rhizobium sp. 3T7 TaxID=2874922 RepID=UPI001CCA6D23|nr:hypothetical protein [Rhizobium sp. 3T7]MBZ9793515.1 hypothetical protein [Rhizobium sp. 3T7]